MTGEPIAFLPMYDLPALRGAWDRLWKGACDELAQAGIADAGPLRRSGDLFGIWTSPDLLIGQTCGWPLVSMLKESVAPLARFDFGLAGLKAGDYRSVFICCDALDIDVPGDLEALLREPATRIAVNGLDSQSGYRVLGECVSKPLAIASERLVLTGSHANSVAAVAQGSAQMAAIDAVTWRYLEAFDANAGKVNAVARSAGVPGLPLITSTRNRQQASMVFGALEKAIHALDADTSNKLGIRGLVPANADDYMVLEKEPFGRVTFA